MSNKKRSHAERILQRMSKRASQPTERKETNTSNESEPTLREQYDIIRGDILKLRDDLNKGYDMAKNLVDRKNLLNILKAR